MGAGFQGARRLAVHKPCHPWLRRAVFDVREGNSAASGGPETDCRFVSCRTAGIIDQPSPLFSRVSPPAPTSESRPARALSPSTTYGSAYVLRTTPYPHPTWRRTRRPNLRASSMKRQSAYVADLERIFGFTGWKLKATSDKLISNVMSLCSHGKKKTSNYIWFLAPNSQLFPIRMY